MRFSPSRALRAAIAAELAAAALIATGSARAADTVAVAPTLFLSVSIGDKTAFGIGADVRMSGLVRGKNDECNTTPRVGFGPFAQATWLIPNGGRFAFGGHGGGEVAQPAYAIDGELGWTYRTSFGGSPGGHGVLVGLQHVVFGGSIASRATFSSFDGQFAPEGTLTAGFGYPPVFGIPGTCIIGRPLRDGEAVVLPPLFALGPARRAASRLDAASRSALAEVWSVDARTECASVPAFIALARDLLRVGAPPGLVAWALAAAAEEVRHTELCSAIAGSLSGVAVAPALLAPPRARDASDAALLIRLAREGFRDGCLGEGAAAERARRGATAAADPVVKSALCEIARDEARHAELGFAVIDFCLARGGRAVRHALEAELEGPAVPAQADADVDDAVAARAFGRVTGAAAESAWAHAAHRGEQRLARLLQRA